MYLASFSYRDTERIGARIDGDCLIDFRDAADALGRSWDYATMLDLIAGGAEAEDAASRLLDAASASPEVERIPMADIVWHPPVTRPGKICGVALNNSASDARKISSPDHPMFFLKPSTCLVGHLQPIVARTQYMGFHPEPELGVVISTLARNVDPSKAMAHVYGYTIFNDVTGNDMRAEDRVHYYALYPKPDNPDEVEQREQHLPTPRATRARIPSAPPGRGWRPGTRCPTRMTSTSSARSAVRSSPRTTPGTTHTGSRRSSPISRAT